MWQGGIKMAKIIFEKIENEDIFASDYKRFTRNNEMELVIQV